MPQCTGCSKPYKFLAGQRCESCSESASPSKPRTEWPLCPHCGKRFEFIEREKPCSVCQDRDSQDLLAMPPPSQTTRQHSVLSPTPNNGSQRTQHDDIDYAMTHSVNARTHSARDGPAYRNPLQSFRNCDENDPRYLRAQEVAKDFQNGYANAFARANPGTQVAKSKFKGTEDSIPKPVVRINIVIRKLINRNKRTTTTTFDPQNTAYEDTKLWSEVVQNIKIWLDGVYSRAHGHRIWSEDDFTLYYTHGRVMITDIATKPNATVRDVWRKSTEQEGLLVQVKSQKALSLELDAYVEYPVKKPDPSTDISDYESQFPSHSLLSSASNGKHQPGASSVSEKRKRIDSLSSAEPFKRSNKSGSYITNVAAMRPNPSQEIFIVSKLTLSESDDCESMTWSTSSTTYEVWIEKKEFSSGSMKHAYKLQFNNPAKRSTVYAAKRYFEIGNGIEPTAEENHKHLKEEMTRQLTLQHAVNQFTELAKLKKVPIYDLKIPTTFLLQEADNEYGMTWIVDPLLDHRRMRKFSGSNEAGSNIDFAGQTCDAFAHFTLADSMVFVPVDIQGIDMPVVTNGIKGANAITLLDSMAHSQEQTMGLGDNGMAGIREFCKQHSCNPICKRLGLPDVKKILIDLTDVTLEEDSQSSESESESESLAGSIIPPPDSKLVPSTEETESDDKA